MRRFSLSSPQIPSGSGAVSFQPIVCSVLFGLLQCVIKMIGQPHLENKVNSFQTRGRICCETEATTQLLHNCGFLRLTLLQEYSSTRDTWTGRHERKSLLWTEGTWLIQFQQSVLFEVDIQYFRHTPIFLHTRLLRTALRRLFNKPATHG